MKFIFWRIMEFPFIYVSIKFNTNLVRCNLTMINLSRDIQSLSTFKRNTNELIAQMKESGNPLILTVNGKAELVVQDAISYQKLFDTITHLETIIGIKKGLDDMAKNDTQCLNQFMEEMQNKHEISSTIDS